MTCTVSTSKLWVEGGRGDTTGSIKFGLLLYRILPFCAVQNTKKKRRVKHITKMHKSYKTRDRLKKLTTDSVNETLGRTSIPIVSCSCRESTSVGHALFDMYDLKPTYRPREYPGRITKNCMREEAMPCSMSGNRSRTCFWARYGRKNNNRSDDCRGGGWSENPTL